MAKRSSIAKTMPKTVVGAVGQGRSVREPSQRFPEGQIAVERPLRLWGKADVDARLAHATAEAGDLAVTDARHESTRQILALWFAVMRAGQARLAPQDTPGQTTASHAGQLLRRVTGQLYVRGLPRVTKEGKCYKRHKDAVYSLC